MIRLPVVVSLGIRLPVVVSLGCAAFALFAMAPNSAQASDSSLALGVGGLSFGQGAGLAMESEDLTVTPDSITVRYRLVNPTPQPVTTTISFALPDIDLSDPDVSYAFPVADPVNFVGFATTVDGVPASFEARQRAMIGDKDVTSVVRSVGLTLLPLGDHFDRLKALTPEARERLVDDGVLQRIGTDERDQPIIAGAWRVKTSFVRSQSFPPGQPVTIEHHYRTSVGISLDTVLRKAVRDSQVMQARVSRYYKDYCVPDSLLRGLDKVTGPFEENVAHLQERRIDYLLKSGGGWNGPIKEFRLAIDKGHPNALVSFCLDNVKKISPTTFEMRATDFTPKADLKILMISKKE